MTQTEARLWIIKYSLVATIACFVFFVLAPPLGYPLTYAQSIRVMQIITPVFLGYLGAATQFAIHNSTRGALANERPLTPLFVLLVKGPIAAFTLVLTATVAAFYVSNRPTAVVGEGMSVDVLAMLTTGALGFLTVTTNIFVAYLFRVSGTQQAAAARKPAGT
jgi:hypothetical protein